MNFKNPTAKLYREDARWGEDAERMLEFGLRDHWMGGEEIDFEDVIFFLHFCR
jgi:hypothetical protein